MMKTNKPVQPERNLNAQALKIIENVFHACKNESTNNLKCPKKTASLYTGVPLDIIESIRKEPTSYPETDLSLHIMIRKTLKKFYNKEEEPTCRQLYDILRAQQMADHGDIGTLSKDFAGFPTQLVQLGYETVKITDGGQLIMEIPKYTFERYHYIKKIRKARTIKNKMYYLSVRIYNKQTKCMVPIDRNFLNNSSSEGVLTSYHLISKDGCDNLFFSFNYDTDSLMKWVLQVLMPVLKPSSYIIIDNAHLFDYLGKQLVSEYHPKKDLLNWLKDHNLPCTPSMSKAELFQLIEKCSLKLESNSLENVFQAFGHDVICMPEQMHYLAPTQLLWKDINNKLKARFISDSISKTTAGNITIKGYICDDISSLEGDVWKQYDQVIKNAEEDLFALDAEIENYLDKYKFDLDSIVPNGNEKWSSIAMS